MDHRKDRVLLEERAAHLEAQYKSGLLTEQQRQWVEKQAPVFLDHTKNLFGTDAIHHRVFHMFKYFVTRDNLTRSAASLVTNLFQFHHLLDPLYPPAKPEWLFVEGKDEKAELPRIIILRTKKKGEISSWIEPINRIQNHYLTGFEKLGLTNEEVKLAISEAQASLRDVLSNYHSQGKSVPIELLLDLNSFS